MKILDHQLKILSGCSLSLLQMPLIHLSPFCCTLYVPLLPLRFLKVSKGSKGISQIHLNEHELPHGTWNSWTSPQYFEPTSQSCHTLTLRSKRGDEGIRKPKISVDLLNGSPSLCLLKPTNFLPVLLSQIGSLGLDNFINKSGKSGKHDSLDRVKSTIA